MRKNLWAAALGFLIGAAAIAGGEDDDAESLRAELARLQQEAARAAQKDWELRKLPPADGAGQQLAIFPLEDLAAPRYGRIPPSCEFLDEGSEWPLFGAIEDEGTMPFGTIEEMMEGVREADPEAWERATIEVCGDRMVAVAYPVAIGRVRELLDRKWRPLAHAGVAVDFDIVEVPTATARTIGGHGKPLTNAQRTALEEAVRTESGRRILLLRAAGLQGSRFYAWHGRQVALLTDADVEVAQTASVSDPVIQIAQAGGLLSVIARQGDSPRDFRLSLALRLRELEEVRSHETDQAGVLDQPTLSDQEVKLDLRAPAGAWIVAGTGSPRRGVDRLFLVRATPLPRGEVR